MAADLIMPVLPGNQQSQHFYAPHQRPHPHANAHARTQSFQIPQGPQISPLSTSDHNSLTSSPSNPTSPRAYHARQVRPLYMPAALRPNLFPSKQIKPKAQDAASTTSTDSDCTLRRTNSGIMNLSFFGKTLSRTSTGDSSKSSLDGDFDLEMFPEVTDLPTRKHWKPDQKSTICDDPTCKRTFTYFTRRHHCRKCGNIFCDWHSSYVVPLDQDAKYNPRAAPSRTCNHCFEEYKIWHSRNNSQASSAASSDAPHNSPTTPIATGLLPGPTLQKGGPDVAASVPTDWNWSTF